MRVLDSIGKLKETVIEVMEHALQDTEVLES